jgi:hypothetical protein
MNGLRIVIYVEEAEATLWLATPIGGTAGIEKQLAVVFLVKGEIHRLAFAPESGRRYNAHGQKNCACVCMYMFTPTSD